MACCVSHGGNPSIQEIEAVGSPVQGQSETPSETVFKKRRKEGRVGGRMEGR
jgi:hypothetical protein